jgi:hypothetical protein
MGVVMSEIEKNDCQGEWVDEGDTSFDEGHDAGYEAGRFDAADELASLQSQLNEAREIVQEFAGVFDDYAAIFSTIPHSDAPRQLIETSVKLSTYRRARAFLNKTEGKSDE